MAKEKKARVKERMQDMGEDVSDDDADEGKGRGKSGWDDGGPTMLPFQDQMRDKMLRKRRELGDVDGGLKEIEEDIRKQSDAWASKLDKREMKAKRKAEKEAREAERTAACEIEKTWPRQVRCSRRGRRPHDNEE